MEKQFDESLELRNLKFVTNGSFIAFLLLMVIVGVTKVTLPNILTFSIGVVFAVLCLLNSTHKTRDGGISVETIVSGGVAFAIFLSLI